MTKLLVVTTFAVVAFAAGPAAACEWNREASTNNPAVAATNVPGATADSMPPPQTASVASDQSTSKPVWEPAPIVQVSDRH